MLHSVLWLKSVLEVGFYFFTWDLRSDLRAWFIYAPNSYLFRMKTTFKTHNKCLYNLCNMHGVGSCCSSPRFCDPGEHFTSHFNNSWGLSSSSSATTRVVVGGCLVFISCASGFIGAGTLALASEAGASESRLYTFESRVHTPICFSWQ